MSQRDFTHSGFFALRTPLLPLEFLRSWSSGEPSGMEADGPGGALRNGQGGPDRQGDDTVRAPVR